MMVIQEASRRMNSWRLTGTTLYVTLEPCTIGAIVLARISRLVFGATDPKAGACGSIMNIPPEPRLNHRAEVDGGLLAEESQALLQDFFRRLRKEPSARENLERASDAVTSKKSSRRQTSPSTATAPAR